MILIVGFAFSEQSSSNKFGEQTTERLLTVANVENLKGGASQSTE